MIADIKDLVVLTADADAEETIRGLLSKPQRLGIRQINHDLLRHADRDPGCWTDAENFLRSQVNYYLYALVIFDHDGCGQEHQSVEDLQEALEKRLSINGWDERARVVIIKPELEIWVWSDSSQVDQCLGWSGRNPDLRAWLRGKKLLEDQAIKPPDPKTAMRGALREVKKPVSPAIFKQLAEQVSFSRCTDASFIRLRQILQEWFPVV